jgi:hypothetical protein
MAKLWCGSGLIRRFLVMRASTGLRRSANEMASSDGSDALHAQDLMLYLLFLPVIVVRWISFRRYGRGGGSCYKGEAKNVVEAPDSLIAVVQKCSPSLCGLPQQGSWLLVLRIPCSR